MLPVVLGLMGCATTAPGAMPPPRAVEEQAASDALWSARQALDANLSDAVVEQLQGVMSSYPGTQAAKDAQYYLGLALYKLEREPEALTAFVDYLRTTPQGKHAAECAEFVARLSVDDKIAAKQQLLAQNPESVGDRWELADLLWRRGNYDGAGKEYMAVVAKHPEYAEDKVFKSRVELTPDGQFVVLTPKEVERRVAESQPLVIINQSSFRTGQSEMDVYGRFQGGQMRPQGYRMRQEAQDFAVTGQALNRSKGALDGVQVTVTIYGTGGIVLDSNVVNIGRMNAGQVRPFSVRFNTFKDISDIARYECVGTFQR